MALYQQFKSLKSLTEDLETEWGDVIFLLLQQCSVVEPGQNATLGLGITEWNPPLSGHEGTFMWFCDQIGFEEWRYEMIFQMYVWENELNVTLQGNGLFVHEMFKHFRSFKTKLGLFTWQARASFIITLYWVNRKCLQVFCPILGIICWVWRMRSQDTDFKDFKKIESEFNNLSFCCWYWYSTWAWTNWHSVKSHTKKKCLILWHW